jgi:hypothetical protein
MISLKRAKKRGHIYKLNAFFAFEIILPNDSDYLNPYLKVISERKKEYKYCLIN